MNESSITLFKNLHDRYRFIEFSLKYKCFISRSDLIEKFNISEASATRSIKEYIELSNHQNAVFNTKTKNNEITDKFKPIYNISDSEALAWLQLEKTVDSSPLVYNFHKLNLPSEEELSPIVQAIINERLMKIKYLSMNSGEKERIIAPHSIFNDGLRLYIRVFDKHRGDFIDLTAARIIESSFLEEKPFLNERIGYDHKWNHFVELSLIAHPKLNDSAKKVIHHEYKMIRKKLKISVRESTINYFLRVWNVDCSLDSTLSTKTYYLALENINSVKNMLKEIAPGFKKDKEDQ